jgi:hypothetical protein
MTDPAPGFDANGGYTPESMMHEAGQRLANARSSLARCSNPGDYDSAEYLAMRAAQAQAEATAGLLAVELAKYADGTGWAQPEFD